MIDMNKERELFEEAYLSVGGKQRELEIEDGEYTNSKSQLGWELWQIKAKSQGDKVDESEVLKNVEIILERLTFHIFEDVMIWSNEAASKAFTRCVKKTVEDFKNGQLILSKGYPQLKHLEVDNVLNALNSALHQAQEHQDHLNAELDQLKETATPNQIINEVQSWIAVKSNQAMELDGEEFVVGANELAEFIEQLVNGNSGAVG
ncbi:hypothetical protein [Acinetobacter baumannii]|uniref:hypothetical protein n=1 Tax=Acinetobacter baumannii TaxID=470 RepID=UPI0020C08D09|nr:hypothetical protein [Acinetobacter baumannii]MCL6164841.1 hypothetical protein [Acinetobacter baumannii]MCL6168061.1 hypothetical protein [Acinetobacter baumannii]MCL6172407.1 hypothetical protein [Acinetobacter baumannii]MCL6192716.1 hypothetical protein [Acinetobacter baumannii]MCL6196306.1 hypothetical protein [Acinetobacter baumannii]